MRYKVADLFCGAGGLSHGTFGTDFETVISLDSWKCAIETKHANGDKNAILFNLEDVKGAIDLISPLNVDAIVGGPPCQDFSLAGKGEEGNRAELTKSFARIISAVAPKIFLMENVPAAQRSLNYKEARAIFKASGYGLTELTLNAANFGVPQNRRRFIVIGILKGADNALEPYILNQATTNRLSIKEFWPEVPYRHFYRHPRSYQRRAVFSVEEPSPTIRGVNRPRPKEYKPHPGDTTTEIVSALSTEDRAFLQSFPREYIWKGSNTEVEQMIGNAVPPVFANKLFKAIQKHISEDL